MNRSNVGTSPSLELLVASLSSEDMIAIAAASWLKRKTVSKTEQGNGKIISRSVEAKKI